MARDEKQAAARARRNLERVVVWTLFITPLLMNPVGQSICGRIKESAMWVAAGWVGLLLTLVVRGSLPARLSRPAVFWILTTLASVCVAYSRTSSGWAAFRLLPPLVLAVGIATAGRRAPARRRIMCAWVASAGISSAYAIVQHYGIDVFHWVSVDPLQRALGTIGAPIYLGAFLAMALPFAMALSRVRMPPRYLPAAIVMVVIALAVSYSRAAWVAAAMGIVVMMYASGRASARPVKREISIAMTVAMMTVAPVAMRSVALAAVIAFPLAVFVLWWLVSIPGFKGARRALALGLAVAALAVYGDTRRPKSAAMSRITQATASESQAASVRRTLMGVAMTLIPNRPVLGWGPDAFSIASSSVARDGVSVSEPLLYPHQSAHSEWFTAAVEGGVLGLLAWTAVILSLASLASDRTRAEQGLLTKKGSAGTAPACCPTAFRRSDVAAAVFGGVAAFVVQGCLTPRGPITTLGLALCWGLICALEPAKRQGARKPVRIVWAMGYAWCALCLVVFSGTCAADFLNWRGDRLHTQGRLEAAVPLYRLAAQCNPMEPGYHRVWGESALELASAEQGIDAYTMAEDAAEAYSANLAAEPGNGLWRAGLAQALAKTDPVRAVTEARRAVHDAPYSASAWYALSQAYRARGDDVGELNALRAAVTFEPVEPTPYVRLASVFREHRRTDLGYRVIGWAADQWPDDANVKAWYAEGERR